MSRRRKRLQERKGTGLFWSAWRLVSLSSVIVWGEGGYLISYKTNTWSGPDTTLTGLAERNHCCM